MSFTKTSIGLLLALLAFNSCQTPSAPQTATIQGRVELAKVYWLLTPPYSGITVTIEGTSHSAVTDDSGYYTLHNVPTGTYNVRFSKPGYGDVRWMAMTVTGGGNTNVDWTGQYVQRLYKQSSVGTSLNALQFVDTTLPGLPPYAFMRADGIVAPDLTRPQSEDAMAVYVSHTPDVSSQPGHYVKFFYASNVYSYETPPLNHPSYPIDTALEQFHFFIPTYQLTNAGFNSGDSIYVATYGAPTYGSTPTQDYYDATRKQYVLTSINQTPSPVVGSVMP